MVNGAPDDFDGIKSEKIDLDEEDGCDGIAMKKGGDVIDGSDELLPFAKDHDDDDVGT